MAFKLRQLIQVSRVLVEREAIWFADVVEQDNGSVIEKGKEPIR